MNSRIDMESAYLDNAATTAMLPEALEVMYRESANVGNASSLHGAGRRARRVVEESREKLAAAVGAKPQEIIFTASGTEANNLAVKGLYWRAGASKRAIVSTPIEHHAILDPLEWLEREQSVTLHMAEVDSDGTTKVDSIAQLLSEYQKEISFVTVMHSNNEVGALQPVAEIAAISREYEMPIHTDAVQSFGKVPLDFGKLGVSALTISGHKIGGPLGVAALVAKKDLELTPLLHGGGQERDVRSGTLHTPAIAAFATAAELSQQRLQINADRIRSMRERLINGVTAAVDDVRINGGENTLPGIAHFTFAGAEGDALLLLLDAQGVQCSTGSACSAGIAQPSHVLIAMGMAPKIARSSIRFSIGTTTSEKDIDKAISVISEVVSRARAAGVR
ncbi:MAG: cysteine desulfurase family protein [Candidatus Nanopelagicaceae bacterium]